MAFAQFMNSTMGRVVRIVAGLALIVVGMVVSSALGVALIVIGMVPLAAGVFDFCLFAPILSVPWRGAKIRAMK